MIIFITIDSLREDVTTPSTLPESWVYLENDFFSPQVCLSHGVATPFAFPGLITGEQATGDGSLSTDAVTIGELVESATALPNNPHLSGERGYHRGFKLTNDETGEVPLWKRLAGKFPGAKTLRDLITPPAESTEADAAYTFAEDVTSWLIDSTSQDLIWAHYMDPHCPFTNSAAPGIDDVNATNIEIQRANDAFINREADRSQIELLWDLYKKNIQYLDVELARLFQSLKNQGVYERATIIITADHGESFDESGVQNHDWGSKPIDELIKVPLFVKPGEHTPKPDFSNIYSHIDLYQYIKQILSDETVKEAPNRPECIISKSNGYVRGTEIDATAFKSRDGEIKNKGLSNDGLTKLKRAPVPSIKTLSGDVLGQSPEKVKKRLEALGYQ